MKFSIKNIKDTKFFKSMLNIKDKSRDDFKYNINDNIKNKRREITLMIVITIIVALFFSGYSFGKEQSNVNINSQTSQNNI